MQRSTAHGEKGFAEERDYQEVLLTENQAAAFLGHKPRTLQKWRVCGGGPLFISISKRSVRYRRRDLLAWAEARVKRTTSDAGQDRLAR